jgi:hypothetical protein
MINLGRANRHCATRSRSPDQQRPQRLLKQIRNQRVRDARGRVLDFLVDVNAEPKRVRGGRSARRNLGRFANVRPLERSPVRTISGVGERKASIGRSGRRSAAPDCADFVKRSAIAVAPGGGLAGGSQRSWGESDFWHLASVHFFTLYTIGPGRDYPNSVEPSRTWRSILCRVKAGRQAAPEPDSPIRIHKDYRR